jgi:hypothetical protein
MAALLLAVIVLTATPARAAEHPALAKARALYNAADYDGAIASAAIARGQENYADAAALVAARSHLERFRLRTDPADLAAARDALTAVRVSALSPRDQLDLLVGLGQSLYLGEAFGASAEIFDTALGRGIDLNHRDRLMLLDWWANALDRDAQRRPADRRAPVYQRIAERMEDEVRLDPGNAPANYWLAAAARGMGDLDRAFDVAVAAWVRARLSPDTTDGLRADLDRLVAQGVIPERSRVRPPRDLQTEWDSVKQQWK